MGRIEGWLAGCMIVGWGELSEQLDGGFLICLNLGFWNHSLSTIQMNHGSDNCASLSFL